MLLLIVDASKMPDYRSVGSTMNALLGTIRDQSAIGRGLHQRMLELLEVRYGDRLAVTQIDLEPQDGYNVMTTWALDRRSLDLLQRSFKKRWGEERDCLLARWRFLAQGEVLPEHCPTVDRKRLPLD